MAALRQVSPSARDSLKRQRVTVKRRVQAICTLREGIGSYESSRMTLDPLPSFFRLAILMATTSASTRPALRNWLRSLRSSNSSLLRQLNEKLFKLRNS